MRTHLGPTLAPLADRVQRWRDERLADPRHGDRVAALLGLALGIAFSVCFATGLLSHLIQHPPSWFEWRARPAGLYRVTQGLHVATGIASVPLLFAKLWSVFPRLFRWPLATDWVHALERLSLLPLVGGAIFLLVTGVANIELWYPWSFFFPAGHYAVAWVTMGGLVIHVVAKIHITKRALLDGEPVVVHQAAGDHDHDPVPQADDDLVTNGRRRFLTVVGASSVALVAVTVGQTVSPLRRIALLAPRRPDIGVQGFPVNRTAIEADVVEAAMNPAYAVSVEAGGVVLRSFGIDEIRAMPMRTAKLPVACVEGWSVTKTWTGVPLRRLVEMAGAQDVGQVNVESYEREGRYQASTVDRNQFDDDDTLLALFVEGEPLAPDHGYPLRLIGPNRPGVLQTKWVAKLVIG